MSSQQNEPVTLSRDVEAVIVPAGTAITLKAGLSGFITQALGGSFTLYIEGNLYRIPGAQADAIGKEVMQAPELPPGATEEDVRELAWAQMRRCYDPEIPVNIVDLGLVYDCTVTAAADGQRQVSVSMTLTAPGCGMGDFLRQDVQQKLLAIPGVAEADVEVVLDPPWDQSMMSDSARLQLGLM